MTLTFATWTLTILSLIGVYLNIKKKRSCFYIWGVTNAGWMVIDIWKDIPAQAALFGVYFLLALWGMYEWRRR